MEIRAHAQHALTFVRGMTEAMLRGFQTREDWLYQAHPKANHALWIAAHLGLVDNAFAGRFRPATKSKPEGWDALFLSGSVVTGSSDFYPPEAEVLAYFRERRENLQRVFAELTDEELAAPAPPKGERTPIAGAPNMGHAFIFISQHEALHGGQLSVAHRGIGNEPLLR